MCEVDYARLIMQEVENVFGLGFGCGRLIMKFDEVDYEG